MSNSDKEPTYWYDTDNKELVLEEDDREYRFYLQDKFDFEGKKYCILTSSESKDEEESLLMRVEKEEDKDILVVIEDDSEFEAASRHYYSSQSDNDS
ncbi:MAG: DUF1292 domain-containing protein [Halarsenatibacteraceae bacterium]